MMAFLTRPKFQDGGPVAPPEKPPSDILFKRKINNLLTGFYGTTGSKGFLVDEIQNVLDEAEKKGVLSKEDGLNFVRERKKYYDNYFADRAQKQRLRGVVEGIGTVDRKEFYKGELVCFSTLNIIIHTWASYRTFSVTVFIYSKPKRQTNKKKPRFFIKSPHFAPNHIPRFDTPASSQSFHLSYESG